MLGACYNSSEYINEKNLISLNTIFIDKQKCSASIKIAIFNDE